MHYHAGLPAAIREEYPLSQLRDDFRLQLMSIMLGLSIILAGQLDPASMPAEKYEFTWKNFWPSVFRRLNQLYAEEGIQEFARQLVEGEYHNYGNNVEGKEVILEEVPQKVRCCWPLV